jgi:hypothetical protein
MLWDIVTVDVLSTIAESIYALIASYIVKDELKDTS